MSDNIQYCKNKLRKNATNGMLLYGVITIIGLFGGISAITTGKRENMIIGVILIVAAIYCAVKFFVNIQGLLFPRKSSIGKSILSQQDGDSELYSLEELFEQVDEDIAKNGKTFNTVLIGDKWLLGDSIMRLDHIRGIFYIEVSKSSARHGHRTEYALGLVDDKQNPQITKIQTENQLQEVYDYLLKRFPDLKSGDYEDYIEFMEKSDTDFAAYNNKIISLRTLKS